LTFQTEPTYYFLQNAQCSCFLEFACQGGRLRRAFARPRENIRRTDGGTELQPQQPCLDVRRSPNTRKAQACDQIQTKKVRGAPKCPTTSWYHLVRRFARVPQEESFWANNPNSTTKCNVSNLLCGLYVGTAIKNGDVHEKAFCQIYMSL
jgi:hypothetical protein